MTTVNFIPSNLDIQVSDKTTLEEVLKGLKHIRGHLKYCDDYNDEVGFFGKHMGFLPVRPDGTVPSFTGYFTFDRYKGVDPNYALVKRILESCATNGSVVMNCFTLELRERDFHQYFSAFVNRRIDIISKQLEDCRAKERTRFR